MQDFESAGVVASDDMYLKVRVNPQLDHYISVDACSAPSMCETSQEILIPKQ